MSLGGAASDSETGFDMLDDSAHENDPWQQEKNKVEKLDENKERLNEAESKPGDSDLEEIFYEAIETITLDRPPHEKKFFDLVEQEKNPEGKSNHELLNPEQDKESEQEQQIEMGFDMLEEEQVQEDQRGLEEQTQSFCTKKGGDQNEEVSFETPNQELNQRLDQESPFEMLDQEQEEHSFDLLDDQPFYASDSPNTTSTSCALSPDSETTQATWESPRTGFLNRHSSTGPFRQINREYAERLCDRPPVTSKVPQTQNKGTCNSAKHGPLFDNEEANKQVDKSNADVPGSGNGPRVQKENLNILPWNDWRLRLPNINESFFSACKSGDLTLFRAAVSQGCDPNYQQGWGLRRAVRYRHPRVWRLLLAHPATQTSLTNLYGLTALHTAARFNVHEAASDLLRHSGSEVNLRTVLGSGPLAVAAKYCSLEVVQVLLRDKRVDLDMKDQQGRLVEDVVGSALPRTSGEVPVWTRTMTDIVQDIREERRKRSRSGEEDFHAGL